MFDDSQLLVRHIRSCFIQGDESGQCEQALDESSRNAHSPSIALPDADDLKDHGVGDRFATNKTGSATKVFYLTALEQLSMEEFFSEKKPNGELPVEPQLKTDLGQLLATNFANPFHKYSRFSAKTLDGSARNIAICSGVRTLAIFIYLTSRNPTDDSPLTVYVNVTNARIADLIGLILWQYLDEKRHPPLPDLDIAHYCLLSADEGDVDFGIPSFDPLEPLSKYGFSTMALAYVPSVFSNKDKSGRPTSLSPPSVRILPPQITVILTHYNFGTHEFSIDSKDVTLAKLIEMYLSKVAEDPAYKYYVETLDKSHFALEADSHPGRLYDNLEMTIGRIGCSVFKIHRKYCNPTVVVDEKTDSTLPFLSPTTLNDLKARGHVFHVAIERTKGKPVDVELVVDTDTLYLNQKEPNISKSIPKTIVRATIESCRLVGADVGTVLGAKQVVRVQLNYKHNDNTIKKLIIDISEQVTAVDLVSLLRR